MTTLASVCLAIVDCEHKTAPIDPSGDYFAVGTPAMRGNVISYTEARKVSRATFEAWTRRLEPRYGDLLLAREAPVGPVVQVPRSENVAPGQRTVLLRPDPDQVDAVFLFQYLTAPATQGRLHEKAAGSTVPHLNVADVRALHVELPPLPMQRAIAAVLAAVDDKIAVNERISSVSDQLSVALVPPTGNLVTVRSLADHVRKQIEPSLIVDIVDHFSLPAFDDGKLPQRTSSTSIKSSKFVLQSPAVLMSKLNPRFPRIWDVVPSPDVAAVASTEFVVLEPREISTGLLSAILNQPHVGEVLEGLAAGTSGSHQRVKPAEILSLMVPNPALMEPGLRDYITALRARAGKAREESVQLAALRDTLLPALMSGKLRVRDAEKALEEVL